MGTVRIRNNVLLIDIAHVHILVTSLVMIKGQLTLKGKNFVQCLVDSMTLKFPFDIN